MTEQAAVLRLIDAVYAEQQELKALLLRHSFDVWGRAQSVLQRHPELGADERLVFEGALAHDVGVIYCNAPKIYCFGGEPYLLHGVLGGRLLRESGFERLAPFAERHTGVGLRAEDFIAKGLRVPAVETVPQTIEEEIVAYADKFLSKSKPDRVKTVAAVERSMLKFGESQALRFREWDKKFGG